jgi:hypothetical protein
VEVVALDEADEASRRRLLWSTSPELEVAELLVDAAGELEPLAALLRVTTMLYFEKAGKVILFIFF